MTTDSKIEGESTTLPQLTLSELRQRLSPAQRSVFDSIWMHYIGHGKAMPVRSIQHGLGKVPLGDLLEGLSGALVFETTEDSMRCMSLTTLGALLTSQGEYLFQLLVRLFDLIRDLFADDCQVQNVSHELVYDKLGLAEPQDQRLLFSLLRLGLHHDAPAYLSGWGPDAQWGIRITDHVTDLHASDSIECYLEQLLLSRYYADAPWSATERLQQTLGETPFMSFAPMPPALALRLSPLASLPGSHADQERTFTPAPFVAPDRISEIETIRNPRFDTRRLVLMCRELSECAHRGNAHATIMLLRAILDHVPPVFGQPTFAGVINNYSGSRSFKEAVGNLDQFGRKIADLLLHGTIRKSETLPTMTQVHFGPPLDLLLAEVAMLLRAGTDASTPS